MLSATHAFASTMEEAQGTYEVPVEEGLEDFATFDVSNILISKDQKMQIQYDLPEDLVGKEPLTININETSRSPMGLVHLEGHKKLVNATCAIRSHNLNCLVMYDTSVIRRVNIDEFLEDKYSQYENIEERLAVAKLFGQEAIGIVSFKLK